MAASHKLLVVHLEQGVGGGQELRMEHNLAKNMNTVNMVKGQQYRFTLVKGINPLWRTHTGKGSTAPAATLVKGQQHQQPHW